MAWYQELEYDGQPVPSAYNKMPPINETWRDYWAAFWELSGSRPLSMGGMGEIPYGEICCWLDENEIDCTHERCNFRRWIKLIDRLYLKAMDEKRERESKAKRK